MPAALALLAMSLLLAPSAQKPAPPRAAIVLDPGAATVRFDGIGGDSGGGGGSRLLLDYAEPARSDILDLLFAPKWGASLHTIKVELGCDGDTTQGAEQTHMRTADDDSPTAFDRGYENWLIQFDLKKAFSALESQIMIVEERKINTGHQTQKRKT